MALETNELFASANGNTTKRIIPRRTLVKTLAAIAGAPSLAQCFPLAYNTSTKLLVPWTNGGANGTGVVNCFLYVAKDSSATEEVQVVVMSEGEIHYDDIVLPSGELQANLKAALQAFATRSSLLVIKGLEQAQ